MHSNRIRPFLEIPPEADPVPPENGGFIALPMALASPQAGAVCAWHQLVYQLALEQVKNQRRSVQLNYDMPEAWN
jgi:hypothetical protein